MLNRDGPPHRGDWMTMRGEGGLLRRSRRALIETYKYHFRDAPDHLVFVHVGKCGGASLGAAIHQSPVRRARFISVSHVHIQKPPVKTRSSYLVAVRNPVGRALSAFNWRRRILIEDGAQHGRFRGEHAALSRYDTLSDLAEALYPDGPDAAPDPDAAAAFHAIHHLREDIAFYLADLLPQISPEQIFGVITTECLDADVNRVLGLTAAPRRHVNSARGGDAMTLSDVARANLRRFLEADYAAIRALDAMHPLTPEARAALLR